MDKCFIQFKYKNRIFATATSFEYRGSSNLNTIDIQSAHEHAWYFPRITFDFDALDIGGSDYIFNTTLPHPACQRVPIEILFFQNGELVNLIQNAWMLLGAGRGSFYLKNDKGEILTTEFVRELPYALKYFEGRHAFFMGEVVPKHMLKLRAFW